MENWKPVIGFDGLYEVSDFGRVKSLARKAKGLHGTVDIPERILSLTLTTGGYQKVLLYRNGARCTRTVHKLVAAAFIGPKTNDGINHKDGDKTNNRPSNLEYCSQLENNCHALRTGLRTNPKGERHGRSKLTAVQVTQIREMAHKGRLQKEIAQLFGVSKQTVCKIVNRQKWQHI